MKTKRSNICILAANLTDVFSKELVKGATSAAKRLDTNLTVMPGKYLGIQHLNDQYDAFYEYQYNVLFSYAAKANFDYIIAPVGTIAYAYDNKQKKRFLDTFSGTPILCVASEIEGYDCLEFDNRSGIKSAVKYLAERGRKHIGIMAGNPDNSECYERYSAYRSGLEENGLDFKESYLMWCDMSHECKKEAETMLDINPELDAIIGINDIIASVVYNVINGRGKNIGKDIAVVGFDDQPFAKELDPPLASVKADAYTLGEVSVEKAVNYLKGIKENRHLVETRFIPRSSCFADMRFANAPEKIFVGDTDSVKRNLKEYISAALGYEKESENIFCQLSELMDLLEKKFFYVPADEAEFKIAYDAINAVFKEEETSFGEIAKLYSLHENLYLWLMRSCIDDNIPYVKRLYHTFGKKMSDLSSSIPPKYAERTHLENIFIRDSLMLRGDLGDSYSNILKRLCNIGSRTSYLYTLVSPIENPCGSDYPEETKWLFRSYSYGANCFSIPESLQKTDTAGVFDNKNLVSDRTRIVIAADLYSSETQYGLVLLEPENFDFFEELELITYQLSSAVRSIDILNNLNKLLTDTKLALAVANDYKYIYCINTGDNSYIKYERDSTDKDFSAVSKGSDYFEDCEKECRLMVHEEDRSKFFDMFSKKTFLERIDNGDSFNFEYRYVTDGSAYYYHLKTIKGTDDNEGLVYVYICFLINLFGI